jgi:hypothetical protein
MGYSENGPFIDITWTIDLMGYSENCLTIEPKTMAVVVK